MAKFINKKEQVFDLKLTSYGHYLLSIGTFKPTYYSFYDDNVIYDKKYAFSGSVENQNNVDKRIKDETQYLESLVLFKDVEETLNGGEGTLDEHGDSVIRAALPGTDVFQFDRVIGDAFLDGQVNYAPAWKVVSLQSYITSSSEKDTTNDTLVPQLNIQANYTLRVVENEFIFDPQDVRELNNRTRPFLDDKVIELQSTDPLYYIEELNTELLTRNF